MDLVEVCELGEGVLVSKRDVEEAMVDKTGDCVSCNGLLAAVGSRGGDEDACVLAVEGSRGPEGAGGVPEGLPLGRVCAEAGGQAKEEAVVLGEVVDGDDGDVRGLWGRVHLVEDVLGEGLWDLVDGCVDAGLLEALELLEGEGLDVTVGGVVDDCDFGHCEKQRSKLGYEG